MDEPHRMRCDCCGEWVLAVFVKGMLVFAELKEWVPRAPCMVCATIKARGDRRKTHCHRCDDTGWTGEDRPAVQLVAINVAWKQSYEVRFVEPFGELVSGEAGHRPHVCALALAA